MRNFFIKFSIVFFVIVLGGIFLLGNFSLAQNQNQTYGDSDVPVILPRSTWEYTDTERPNDLAAFSQ